jgi:23S rRNA pseudouridine1911/1915/1917 synthase
MLTKTIKISEKESGIRIDKYLGNAISEFSRSYVQKLLNEGYVKVNGGSIKQNYRLNTNDYIEIIVPKPKHTEVEAEDITLDIIYEDDYLLVINKPQGMVVHPGAGNFSGTLVNALINYCGDNLSQINGVIRPGIVHRIDKDTSGLILVVKNNEAHIKISQQLKEHKMNRIYVAIVNGVLKHDIGTINAPIGRHPVNRLKMTVTSKNSRNAVTHFKVIERFDRYTLVECKLETGRTHQIRVHMDYIGHPIVGDPIYGNAKSDFRLNGQLLHAATLGFNHPKTGEYMEFKSELPQYFNEVINLM